MGERNKRGGKEKGVRSRNRTRVSERIRHLAASAHIDLHTFQHPQHFQLHSLAPGTTWNAAQTASGWHHSRMGPFWCEVHAMSVYGRAQVVRGPFGDAVFHCLSRNLMLIKELFLYCYVEYDFVN